MNQLASPPLTKMPEIVMSPSKNEKMKDAHLRQSMSIITDAENHLRSLKKNALNLMIEDLDKRMRKNSRMLKPLQLSQEDQDILGVKSPMPKIEEDSDRVGPGFKRQDTFKEEKN